MMLPNHLSRNGGVPVDLAKGENASSYSYGLQSQPSLDYFSFIIRHRLVLAAGILLGLIAGCALALLQTPTYRAEASLEVQGVNENFLNLRNVDPTPPPDGLAIDRYIQTQAEMLVGDELLDRVIERLRLRNQPEFLPEQAPVDTVRSWFGLKVPPIDQVPPIELTKAVRSRLRVVPSRESRIVRIFFDSRDPKLAASFLNVLTEEFTRQRVNDRRSDSTEMRSWLNSQLEELKAKLESSEQRLQEYARTVGLIGTVGPETLAEANLREVQAELLRAQSDQISKQALWEAARDDANGGSVPQALDNGSLREYEAKLTELRRQLAETSSLLTPENYKVARVQAQITVLEGALAQEIRRAKARAEADCNAASRRETSLRNAYLAQSVVVADQAAKAVRYHVLEREAASDKQMYDSMLQQVKESGVAAVLRPVPVRVIGRAKVPAKPFKPNLPLNASLGAFAGLWVGSAGAVLLAQFNRRLRAPGDVELLLNVPELGAVPKIASPNRLTATRPILDIKSESVGFVPWRQSSSDASEAFRNIVASILANRERGARRQPYLGQSERSSIGPQVLLFTSAWPTEGKSTVISNVAASLAETGRRVLLIDCDLRSPRLQDIFGVPNSWGLSNLLLDDPLGDLPVEASVKPTGISGLRLLPSGPGVDNIASMLYSPRFGALVTRLRMHFDFILVDAPPLLHFADARIVAEQCDAAVIVYRANVTTQTAAAWTVQHLVANKIPIVGAVLNDCPLDTANDLYPSSRYYAKVEQRA